MGDELENNIRFSLIAAKAIRAAMAVAKAEMPMASERTQLLTVLTGVAASAGILRIDFDDVIDLVSGAHKLGVQEQEALDKRLRSRSPLVNYLRAAGPKASKHASAFRPASLSDPGRRIGQGAERADAAARALRPASHASAAGAPAQGGRERGRQNQTRGGDMMVKLPTPR